MGFSADDLTKDKFLGGQLEIWQPRNGHRAGVDPVLLAASVKAAAGQEVLELGCGGGIAILCLARRIADLGLTGVELQGDYAELAERNAAENKIDLTVLAADISRIPAELAARSFDHVIANPPYYQRSRGPGAMDAGRNLALAGETPLAVWIDTATRRLRPGGCLTVIQKADRLRDLLSVTDDRLGEIVIQPFSARIGRDTEFFIFRACKGRRSALRLLSPIVLHEGAVHTHDAENYTSEIRAVLREGAPLNFG